MTVSFKQGVLVLMIVNNFCVLRKSILYGFLFPKQVQMKIYIDINK